MADDDSSAGGSKKTTKKSQKKSPQKKSSQKSTESTQKKSAKRSSSSGSASRESRRTASARAESAPRTSPAKLAGTAAQQLAELTGRDVEGVIGLEKGDDGWRVQVEVVEVRRVPNTTDVLALFEVGTDDKGNLESYRRVRRYVRGTPDDDR